jgi:hypothetical protein
MKKRKNSGLLLAARMAAGRAARRIGARVAVAGKRVARKYGKRLATYGVNELESRGQKLLETASGSARQRIARMNPNKNAVVFSKPKKDPSGRKCVYARVPKNDTDIDSRWIGIYEIDPRSDRYEMQDEIRHKLNYDTKRISGVFSLSDAKKRAIVMLVGAEGERKNPCADVSWPPHEPYQLVSRVPVYIPRSNPSDKWLPYDSADDSAWAADRSPDKRGSYRLVGTGSDLVTVSKMVTHGRVQYLPGVHFNGRWLHAERAYADLAKAKRVAKETYHTQKAYEDRLKRKNPKTSKLNPYGVSVPETKKFGGKTYRHECTVDTLERAEEEAEKLKNKKFKVRIVRSPWGGTTRDLYVLRDVTPLRDFWGKPYSY